MSVATGTAVALGLGAAATATEGIVGAKLSGNAAKEAAKDQTSAANYAADTQAKSNAATLEFQKQQAAADQAKYEASQRANYAQYLTKYAAAQGLGAQLGVTLPNAPSYDVALGAGGATPASAAPASPAPAPAAPSGGLPSAISAYVPTAGTPTGPALAAPTGFRLGAGGPLAASPSAAPTVTLRMPDGRVLQGVPRDQVPAALQSGAQVVPV